jgi:hypothetical protein
VREDGKKDAPFVLILLVCDHLLHIDLATPKNPYKGQRNFRGLYTENLVA